MKWQEEVSVCEMGGTRYVLIFFSHSFVLFFTIDDATISSALACIVVLLLHFTANAE